MQNKKGSSFDFAAPPRITTNESAELNAISSLAGWETDYQQVGSGEFTAWFDIYSSSAFTVVSQYCNESVLVSGTPPAGQTALLIPLMTNTGGVFNGRELHHRGGVVFDEHSDTHYLAPADLRLLTIVAPTDHLTSTINCLTGREEGERLVSDWHYADDMPVNLLKGLDSTLRDLWLHASSGDVGTGSDLALSETEQAVVDIVAQLIAGSNSTPLDTRGAINHERIVSCARLFIDANIDAPLYLKTIAKEAGASQRTLESAFKNVLGLAPVQYIKNRRLSAVNEALLLADVEDSNVSTIARAYGFNHMGHFGQDYRTLFQEQPTQTLAHTLRNRP